MNDCRYWLGWLLIILPLHGIEQLLFGLDELYELQGQVGAVLDLFPTRDYGTVVLVFLLVILVQFFVYGVLKGGLPRLVGVTFFGLSAVGESHHVIKTLVNADYFPGAVTAIPFVFVGVMLLRAVVREFRAGRQGSGRVA